MQTPKEFLLDLFFPPRCFGCEKGRGIENPSGFLCLRCFKSIPQHQWLFCPVCERKLVAATPCKTKHEGSSLRGLGVATDYRHPLVRQLIWNFKYQYVEALALPLSQLLADYFRNTLGAAEQETPWIASSIPLHPRRLRWRGFNQAELLAKRFAENLNLPYLNTLERIRYQKPQVEITSRKKRFENIADSFRLAANTSVRNRNIILVDDVVTSGATLEAAAKTLRQAGAKHVWGMVIAKG